MRIFAGHDGGSGCSFYRMETPLKELMYQEESDDDFEVTFADAGDKNGGVPRVTLSDLQGFDVIVAQRWNRHEGLEVWRRARTPYSRLVFELDDDVFHVTPENWQAYQLYGRPDIRDAIEHAAAVADMITVSTEPLAEVMREFNPNVHVLSNAIPGWAVVQKIPEVRHVRPRVGWMGGASHGVDIGIVAEPVRRFLKRFPGWDLQLNSTDYRPTFKVPSDRSYFSPWIQVNTEPQRFYESIDFDIGLCPLAPGTFNDSKCIDSSMRISTDQGVLEAGSIQPGMRVWLDGWHAVLATEHQDEREGLLVTTSRGLQVAVTPEHRLMSSQGWRQARELHPGEVLELVQERCPALPYQRAPWPADGRVTRAGAVDPMAFLAVPEGPSVAITETWGRILGLFTGDGSMAGKTAIRFSCDGQDADLIKSLMADLESAGFRATTDQVTTWGGEVLRRRSVNVASAHLSRFLAGIGAARPHSKTGQRWERTLRVPEVVFRSPESVRAAFLAGLFEADGHVAKSAVALTTKSADLAQDVQRLLWSIGVPSVTRQRSGPQRTPYADRVYWQVWLRLEETKLFALHAGFLSERKRKRLDGILKRDAERQERVNKNGDRRGCVSNNRCRLAWTDEITSIEPCTVSPVDIQVEGEAFSAAGIHSHNSAIKAIEYAARGIPAIATDCPAYRPVIEHGVNGFLVKRDHEWLKYMSELASDNELRFTMSRAAREMAREHLIENRWTEWADAYRSLFAR